MDSFRYYMLAFQVRPTDNFLLNSFQLTCSLGDIHLTFLMQPVTLFPLPSGYCIGVLVKLIDASPHFLMVILTLLIGYQVNVLNLCFLRKHKAITKIINKYVLPENVYNAIVFFFMAYTFTYVIPFILAHLTKEEEYQIIDTNYSKLRHKFEKLSNFAIFHWYLLMVMTTHSSINCLVVIFTVPDFRAFVLFWTTAGKLQRQRRSVSFMNNSVESRRAIRVSPRSSVL
ncbi:hypothetical protein CRE_15265 [Caenorhabditis remanei]|uniref:Uncharacterized protein n=1 Tax=Caenorhabditis remanei TaxID=31234 RepID=E3NX47_CAERE|nr:hypothetical protein CRE_15265 [Caenorhabditis remanei]